MKINLLLEIAARIVVIFIAAILFSYLPETEFLKDIFDDQPCKREYGCGAGFGNSAIKWGARHYYYSWGVFFLFVLSIIHFIMRVVYLARKHYPTKTIY
jgi:hypothetical protein